MKDNYVADELLKLKQLLDSGAITQSEYDSQKSKLLDAPPTPNESKQPQPSPPQKKKKKPGCLIAVIIILLVAIIGTFISNIGSTTPENTMTSDEILAFDDKTWSDYAKLYESHNNFMTWIDGYANGSINALDMYSGCENSAYVFQQLSQSYGYGTSNYQKRYLDVFESAALSDQLAAQSMMKYLNSNKIEDLNNAKKYIEDAKSALILIASNRGTLLADSDLTDDQILERINQSMALIED